MKALTEEGYPLAERVERWVHFASVHKDLFGIIDLLAVDKDVTVGLQVTTKHNLRAREKKIMESPAFPILKKAGWHIAIMTWEQSKTRRWSYEMHWL